MAKPSNQPASPTFEEAITGLESIVESMEHDQLPLGELVAQYEKGTALLGICESLLTEAKNRIELITLRNQSEIRLETGEEPDHIVGPASTDRQAADPDDDDDIRLF